MFKSILAAAAAITLISQVVVSYLSFVPQRAYADPSQHVQVVVPQVLPVVAEIAPVPENPPFTERDLQCMTQNLYFEARDQSNEGMYAVAEVVLNRLSDPEFPKTVCGVIKQKTKTNCQFSWYCDGLSDVMHDKRAETRARMIARTALMFKTDLTNGSKYYHAYYVSPGWTEDGKVKQIQDHIFYTRI